MPRTDAPSAQRKVSALLELWRTQRFSFDGAAVTGLSFSAGVADSRRSPIAAQMLLRMADEQLLLAKQLGRSRVLVAGESAAQPG
jgi:PleD family two-component response regulator